MTTTLKSNKPTYKTLTVIKDNGQSVQIGRCSLASLETLMETQERLVSKYVKSNGAVGKLFLDPEVISDLEVACSLLPIVGKPDTYLDYSEILENWEQLILLFFNGGFNQDTREVDELKPSKVSQLHFLPYMETVAKAIEEEKERVEKEKVS